MRKVARLTDRQVQLARLAELACDGTDPTRRSTRPFSSSPLPSYASPPPIPSDHPSDHPFKMSGSAPEKHCRRERPLRWHDLAPSSPPQLHVTWAATTGEYCVGICKLPWGTLRPPVYLLAQDIGDTRQARPFCRLMEAYICASRTFACSARGLARYLTN